MTSFQYHIDDAVKTLDGYKTTLTGMLTSATPDFAAIANLSTQAALVQTRLDGMYRAKNCLELDNTSKNNDQT